MESYSRYIIQQTSIYFVVRILLGIAVRNVYTLFGIYGGKFDVTPNYPYDIQESHQINVMENNTSTVFENLKSVKCTFNPGPDGIPSNILKHYANCLAFSIALLFNK